jgi:hypothetical protein
MAPNFAFDTRLDNRILKHTTIKDMEVEITDKRPEDVKNTNTGRIIYSLNKDGILLKNGNNWRIL